MTVGSGITPDLLSTFLMSKSSFAIKPVRSRASKCGFNARLQSGSLPPVGNYTPPRERAGTALWLCRHVIEYMRSYQVCKSRRDQAHPCGAKNMGLSTFWR